MRIPSGLAEGIGCLLTCTYSHNINHIIRIDVVYSVFILNSTALHLKPIKYMILLSQSEKTIQNTSPSVTDVRSTNLMCFHINAK